MKFAPGAWRYALPPLLAAPFALLYSVTVSALSLAAGIGTLAFFRDPDRSPPPTGVVSPADGKVSVLRTEGDRVRLGVFMNVWNVHVVRAPFAGSVAEVERSPGAYKPAFSKDSDRNEKVHVRFAADEVDGSAGDGGETGEGAGRAENDVEESDREVTLVAGAFARRIHPYVEAGDDLARGERLGHIAFGSRVDVLFPPSVDPEDLRVGLGENVTAGETVILDSFDAEFEVGGDGFADGRESDGERDFAGGDGFENSNGFDERSTTVGGDDAWT